MTDAPFWETTPLRDMSSEQWESLCDGCAKCCLLKLEDEDTGEVAYTNIACRQLDMGNCQCQNYEHRQILVPDCLSITADLVEQLGWLPKTCAYRRLSEGKTLPGGIRLSLAPPTRCMRRGFPPAGAASQSERPKIPKIISLTGRRRISHRHGPQNRIDSVRGTIPFSVRGSENPADYHPIASRAENALENSLPQTG